MSDTKIEYHYFQNATTRHGIGTNNNQQEKLHRTVPHHSNFNS